MAKFVIAGEHCFFQSLIRLLNHKEIPLCVKLQQNLQFHGFLVEAGCFSETLAGTACVTTEAVTINVNRVVAVSTSTYRFVNLMFYSKRVCQFVNLTILYTSHFIS